MNNGLAFDQNYRHVLRQTVDELTRFRATHPLKHTFVHDVQWEYIATGRGSEALLILPGLLGIGEMSFQHIRAFENDYCVIAPSYPFELTTVNQTMDGIAAILTAEGIQQAHGQQPQQDDEAAVGGRTLGSGPPRCVTARATTHAADNAAPDTAPPFRHTIRPAREPAGCPPRRGSRRRRPSSAAWS